MEEAAEACCGRSERTEIAPPTVRRHSRYGATDQRPCLCFASCAAIYPLVARTGSRPQVRSTQQCIDCGFGSLVGGARRATGPGTDWRIAECALAASLSSFQCSGSMGRTTGTSRIDTMRTLRRLAI